MNISFSLTIDKAANQSTPLLINHPVTCVKNRKCTSCRYTTQGASGWYRYNHSKLTLGSCYIISSSPKDPFDSGHSVCTRCNMWLRVCKHLQSLWITFRGFRSDSIMHSLNFYTAKRQIIRNLQKIMEY